jgi:DNA-binding NarL/FixJ family response regulator
MNKKILIADEQYVVRIGTSKVLEKKFANIGIDYAESFDEAKKKLQIEKFDLIILEIKMPKKIFTLVIKELKAIQKDVMIMIFSTCKENIAIQYVQEGANGYLNKSSNEETLTKAVQLIFEEGYYYPISLLNKLSEGKSNNNPKIILSKREFQVFELLAKGTENSKIAIILGIHIATVTTYKNRIYTKLGIHNMVDLIKVYNKKYLNMN